MLERAMGDRAMGMVLRPWLADQVGQRILKSSQLAESCVQKVQPADEVIY
jgi:hypothetical protein